MARNDDLKRAQQEKNDEFYTLLPSIENELKHYDEKKFKDKIIFCNCDDPTYSNFWRYFHMNFERLGLKKLITTHYEKGTVQTYKMEYCGGDDTDFSAGKKTNLTQNGDFRSPECVELLDEADMVVTNPPFSLFAEFITLLTEHHKKFIILGNMNALHYKDIFPFLKNQEIWPGFTFNKTCEFLMPDSYKLKGTKSFIDDQGRKHGFVSKITWFTNVDHVKRHKVFETVYKYAKKDELYSDLYQKYDNFDAINIEKVNQIPLDYDGIMGVPDGFFEFYNPEQFELIGLSSGTSAAKVGVKKNYRGRTDLSFITKDGKHKCPFSRILIRKKK